MKNKFTDQAPFAPKEKTARPITKRWWFYVLIAVVVIAAINAFTGGKKNDKINWDNVELHQRLPVPPSNKGSLYTNTAEELSVHIDKVSDDRYTAYLSECIAKGFTVDADKGTSDYSAYDAEGYFLSLSHIGERLSISLEAPMAFGRISWPTSVLGQQVPAPKSTMGKFNYEYENHFSVYIGDTSKAAFDQYVTDCAAAGFHANYDKGDTYYRADNAAGSHISLTYKGNNVMLVELEAPKGTSGTAPDSEPVTPTPDESDKSDQQENTSGLRSDFKAAMDSYEAFVDEYVAFMEKYNNNPSDIGLIADYASYMRKYADFAKKFEQWENEDLNDDELAYYIEVQTRVNQKLLDVTYN